MKIRHGLWTREKVKNVCDSSTQPAERASQQTAGKYLKHTCQVPVRCVSSRPLDLFQHCPCTNTIGAQRVNFRGKSYAPILYNDCRGLKLLLIPRDESRRPENRAFCCLLRCSSPWRQNVAFSPRDENPKAQLSHHHRARARRLATEVRSVDPLSDSMLNSF